MDERMIRVLRDKEEEVLTITPQINEVEPMEFMYDSGKTTVMPLVINLLGPVPYEYEKDVPYKYNATMEDGKEVPILSIVNIVDISLVTRSGRVVNRAIENVEKSPKELPHKQDSPLANATQANENDEILKLI